MTGSQGTLERQGATGAETGAPVTVAQITPLLDLPYAFAKAHGLVLRHESNARLIVAMREGADPLLLLEVRRYLAMPFPEGMRITVDPARAERIAELHRARVARAS